eukprot:TRINITY_DN11994_c0_g1_i1.p1 TRINITY_DN11994_c0_g1~~TRINITY_DN11994_c0_g1_i1.p1  ORF type:complete len:106 (+),score=9.73 TRINITY_DN11994_c0_g1_i1:297-614(+)
MHDEIDEVNTDGGICEVRHKKELWYFSHQKYCSKPFLYRVFISLFLIQLTPYLYNTIQEIESSTESCTAFMGSAWIFVWVVVSFFPFVTAILEISGSERWLLFQN